MNTFIDLNIAILPGKELSEKLISWSRLISSKFAVHYVLDGVNFLPHLSLYSARYPLKNKDLIFKNVSGIVSAAKPFPVTLSSFSLFSGFLFYDAVKNTELQKLHQNIVETLNPLRQGLISDNQKQLTGLSPDQKKAIKNYGYVSVKNLYLPHISLTHLVNSEDAPLVKQILPVESNTFSVQTVAISGFASYGTFPPTQNIFTLP